MLSHESDTENHFGNTVFSVVDVETTGSLAANERMIEFAAYKVSGGKIIDEYTTLLNPGRHIPNFIRDMTGISNDMVYGAPQFREVAGAVHEFLSGTIFTAHNSHFDYSFVRNEMAIAGFDFEMPQLCTRKLSSRVFSQLPRKALGQVCHHLGIKINGRHRAYGDARATAHLLIELLGLIGERHEVYGIDELLRFQNSLSRIDPHKNQSVFKKAMMAAPNSPGVYRVYGADDEIIYVGKAKNLKIRIASYLTQNERDSDKVNKMLHAARKIEFETTASELSAFLRELQLIRLYRPKFNSLLVNPRRFPFIKLSTEKKFDKLDVVYELDDEGRYYGPFENSFIAEQVLVAADKYFKLVKCENDFAKPFDPCLYFHIERCMAPCRGGVTLDEYEREVEAVEAFLSGSFEKLTSELRFKLDELSKKLEFEEAADTRDLIQVLEKTSYRLKLLDGPMGKANFICGWSREKLCEIYAVRRGLLAGPVIVNQEELEPGLTFLLNKSNAISGDFVPLRIILNYALKNPDGFFKIDLGIVSGERADKDLELVHKIKTAAGINPAAVSR